MKQELYQAEDALQSRKMLSLVLTGALQKIYSQYGHDLSRQKMLEELIQIREGRVKETTGKTVHRQLEEMTVGQKQNTGGLQNYCRPLI